MLIEDFISDLKKTGRKLRNNFLKLLGDSSSQRTKENKQQDEQKNEQQKKPKNNIGSIWDNDDNNLDEKQE